MTLEEQLLEVFRAKVVVVFVQTHESLRVMKAAAQVASSGWTTPENIAVRLQPHSWDCVNGIYPIGPAGDPVEPTKSMLKSPTTDPVGAMKQIAEYQMGATFVLHTMDRFINIPQVGVHLLHAIDRFPKVETAQVKRIVMPVPYGFQIPPDLARQATLIEHQLPKTPDLVSVIKRKLRTGTGSRQLQTEDGVTQLAEAGLGMTEAEFTAAIGRTKVREGDYTASVVGSMKRDIVKKSGVLDFFDSTVDIDSVGGLDILKEWLAMRRSAFSEEARAYGLPVPRGVLLLGLPGTGKSLTAKVISQSWDMPLLRLDMSRIFGSLVGQSERNMSAAVQVAEAIAPCVLWLN